MRGGWAAGSFMPYGFVGLAIARADVSRSATISLFNPAFSATSFYFTDTRTETCTATCTDTAHTRRRSERLDAWTAK